MSLYFVDSNIVMYALGKNHEYKESCVQILKLLGDEKIAAASSTEVLQEILYRYFMIGKAKEGLEIAKDFDLTLTEMLPATREDLEKAFKLFGKYLNLPPRDSLHATVMINNGLKKIITVDKHFEQIKEIEKVDPRTIV